MEPMQNPIGKCTAAARWLLPFLLPALSLVSLEVSAQTDREGAATYREHCANCHGQDPAKLATGSLRRVDDRILLKRSDVPLQAFLTKHYGATDEPDRNQLATLMTYLLKSGR
jgi:mono/diheme cytochrome c family protein